VKLSRIAAVARQPGDPRSATGRRIPSIFPNSILGGTVPRCHIVVAGSNLLAAVVYGVFQVPLKLLTGVSPEVALDSDERMVAVLQQLIRGTQYPLNHIHGEISRQHTKAKTIDIWLYLSIS